MKNKSVLTQVPSAFRSRKGWGDYFNLRMPAEPHLHQIEPTNHCTYACVFCPRSTKMTRELGYMDMVLYRKIIDEAAGYQEPVRSKEIELFHFGESLLHPELEDMTGYAADKGLKISLSINASEFLPKRAETILDSRPYKIIISLDGYDEESYKAMRGPRADYRRAVENIHELMKLHVKKNTMVRIVIRMIEMESNKDHTDEFRKTWEKAGAEAEIRKFFPWNQKEMETLGEYDKYPPFMPCPFPWQYLAVQWDGSVVPCCRDFNGVNKVGDANKQSLKEIWHGMLQTKFRQQHVSGDYGSNDLCRDCMEIYYTEG